MSLKRLSTLILIASFCLGASSCPKEAPPFRWNPEIWAGDSQEQLIVRQKNGSIQVIPTSDARFDSMVCIDKSEPRKAKEAYFEVINQCERWKSQKSYQNALEYFDQELMQSDLMNLDVN